MKKQKGDDQKIDYEQVDDNVPRSFVFKMGKVGKSVKELVEDVRLLMAPNTASRLQTRSHNTMKDFLSVAGPLGISHFIVLSQTEKTLSLRIAKTPKVDEKEISSPKKKGKWFLSIKKKKKRVRLCSSKFTAFLLPRTFRLFTSSL